MIMICNVPDEVVKSVKMGTWCGSSVAEKMISNGIPLDKIRAKILEEKECAYADFERYKVEYLGQDLEDVSASLPEDEFRYGMERAIEIIDHYKAEIEP